MNSLWVPDLIFVNGLASSRHQVVRRNALFSLVSTNTSKNVEIYQCWHTKRLSPHGDITLSERFTVSVGCEMNFEMFPFDSQACPLLLESYAYSKSELNFEWQRIGNKRNVSQTFWIIYLTRTGRLCSSVEKSDFFYKGTKPFLI